MYVAFLVILGKYPKRIPIDTMTYLYLGPQHKNGDWFLGLEFTIIRMYCTTSTSCRFPKFLTQRIFALEYIRQWVEIDEIYFFRYRKKGNIPFPIMMGGYAINNKNGMKKVI